LAAEIAVVALLLVAPNSLACLVGAKKTHCKGQSAVPWVTECSRFKVSYKTCSKLCQELQIETKHLGWWGNSPIMHADHASCAGAIGIGVYCSAHWHFATSIFADHSETVSPQPTTVGECHEVSVSISAAKA
jgi:hypothetical protein